MKLATSLAFVALAAASPAIAQTAPTKIELPYTQFTLPTDSRSSSTRTTAVPLVTINVWYHVGLGAREARPHRIRAPVRAPDVHGLGPREARANSTSWLEGVGGTNNGSTENDRTNYWINVPSNAIELALFLESDRMGYLLDSMTPKTVDAQRDVVKNERRQSYENRPYGMAELTLGEMLYPEGHPYHWPVIGYMQDLTAASYEDVVDVLQEVLRAEQRQPRRRRRHRSGGDAEARREVVRRRQAGRRRRADRLSPASR